jgi:hypothetical protein
MVSPPNNTLWERKAEELRQRIQASMSLITHSLGRRPSGQVALPSESAGESPGNPLLVDSLRKAGQARNHPISALLRGIAIKQRVRVIIRCGIRYGAWRVDSGLGLRGSTRCLDCAQVGAELRAVTEVHFLSALFLSLERGWASY